jgi:hypothetical protein
MDRRTGAQGVANFSTFTSRGALVIALLLAGNVVTAAQTTDQVPPSSRTGLTAAAATCGQIDVSWGASTDNVGGSGLKAYIIERGDGIKTTIRDPEDLTTELCKTVHSCVPSVPRMGACF